MPDNVHMSKCERSGTYRKNIAFPIDLANAIQDLAKKENRSFTAQVIYMVKDRLKAKDTSM